MLPCMLAGSARSNAPSMLAPMAAKIDRDDHEHRRALHAPTPKIDPVDAAMSPSAEYMIAMPSTKKSERTNPCARLRARPPT